MAFSGRNDSNNQILSRFRLRLRLFRRRGSWRLRLRRGARSARGRRRWRGVGRRGLRLRSRIDPARLNAVTKAPWHLVVDLRAEPGQATKRRLDMSAGTAEPVIEVEVTKRGVEIIPPHQAHHATAEPDAFRVPGRAADRLGGFDELVGLALIVLGRIGWLRRVCRFAGLVLGARIPALGDRASDADQQGKAGDGEVAQNRTLKLKHTSAHKIPDYSCLRPQTDAARLLPFKWVPNTAGTAPIPMTDIWDFVQQCQPL